MVNGEEGSTIIKPINQSSQCLHCRHHHSSSSTIIMDKKDIEEVLSLENDSNDGGEDINIKGNDEEDFTQSYVESLTKNSLEKEYGGGEEEGEGIAILVQNNDESGHDADSDIAPSRKDACNGTSIEEQHQRQSKQAHQQEQNEQLQKSTMGTQQQERIKRFLQHPSIQNLSPELKLEYLKSKGIQDEIIQPTMDSMETIWNDSKLLSNYSSMQNSNTKETGIGQAPKKNSRDINGISSARNSMLQQQQNPPPNNDNVQAFANTNTNHSPPIPPIHPNQYHYQPQQSLPPELPNPLVPITIGGIISLFGVATFRWLNGGDFVLFPPSVIHHDGGGGASPTLTSNSLSNDNNRNVHSSQHDINRNLNIITGMKDSSNEGDEVYIEEEEEGVDEEDQNDMYHEILQNEAIKDNSTTMLSNNLQNLTLAIEHYAAIQEKQVKDKAKEQAKLKTDNVMDMLRRKSKDINNNSKRNNDDDDDDDKNNNDTFKNDNGEIIPNLDMRSSASVNLQTLVQIIEMKCNIISMKDAIISLVQSAQQSENNALDQSKNMVEKLDNILENVKLIEDKLCSKSSKSYRKDDSDADHKNNMDKDIETTERQILLDQKEEQKNNGLKSVNEKNMTQEMSATTNNIEEVFDEKNPPLDSKPLVQNDESKGSSSSSDSSKANDDEIQYSSGIEAVKEALQKFQQSNETPIIKSCAQMLILYTSNLSSNPNSKQYRKIYTNSKTFIDKVGNVEYAKDVLYAVGFVDEGKSILEWKNYEDKEDALSLLKDTASLLKKIKNGEIVGINSAVN